MKKVVRIISALIMSVMISAQLFPVYAEAATENSALGKSIIDIANKLEIMVRYDDVDKEALYESAIVSLIEENPELYEKVLKSMVSSIDENSAYYNEKETKQLMDTLTDEVTGIGVNVLMNDGNIIVSQPIPNSPAEKAGIKTGDIIIGADDIDLRGLDFDMALDYIRGPIGTNVKIKLLRSGLTEPLSITITREKVMSNPVEYELIEQDEKKIARIIVYSFTDTVYKSFKEALDRAESDGTKNIIIDLRNNGGGYLEQAVKIADLFLPEGALITTEDYKIDIFDKIYTATGEETDYEVVVLINGLSASASEILTAALHENGVAKVIGECSFGKGTVQTIADAPNNSVIKYTSAYYLTPNGNNIHKKGIVPDAQVKNTTEPIDLSQFDTFSLAKTYKVGDKGKEIENAKRMLQYLGIFIGDVNEIYDENLKIAVNSYQQYKGLFPYGVLDKTTQLNLYETMREVKVEIDDQLQTAIDAF